MWKRVHQSRFGLARIEADQYWDKRWIPWSKALYPQQFRPIGRVGGRYEIPPQFPPLPLARRSERNGSAPISLVKPVERDHAGLRPGIVRPVEQAGLDPVGGDEIEEGDAGFLVAESGFENHRQTRDGRSDQFSRVRRRDGQADRLGGGVLAIRWFERVDVDETAMLAVARFCRRIFSAARDMKVETASSSSWRVSTGRPKERDTKRLLRSGVTS